jgi:hypothetical protein
MKGIAKDKVDFVIVAHREFSYYLPPDDTCFALLFATYPSFKASFGRKALRRTIRRISCASRLRLHSNAAFDGNAFVPS